MAAAGKRRSGSETMDLLPRLLTLAEAAERLQWSVRTLRGKLQARGIGTIGRGRIARLTEGDLLRLIEAERQRVPFASPPAVTGDAEWDARMRSYWRRRQGQLNRRKPSSHG
jgi:hypothetical protein